LFILLFIILLLIFFSMTYIKIFFIFHRLDDDNNMRIHVFMLFDIIKLKFNIPYINIILNRNLKPGIKIEEKTLKKKSVFSFREIKNIYNKIKLNSKLFKEVLRYLLSKTKLDSLKWYTHIGLDDAAVTAIFVGVVYTIQFSIVSLITANIDTQDIDVKVIPSYDSSKFEVDLSCIIKIKIVNIIVTGIKILYILFLNKTINKGGITYERTSYSRSDENYNG
jgi:hypothetical protein